MLLPLRTAFLAFFAPFALLTGTASAQVPLTLWKTARHPNGVVVGFSYGSNLGDFDQDGWVDLCVANSGQLFRNENGIDFVRAADLRNFLPTGRVRYSAHFGDFNNDGRPDLAVGGYGGQTDSCFSLLENLGGAQFRDVGTPNRALPQRYCRMYCETLCWADTDGDGNIDLFLPSYPFPSATTNVFLRNRGPVGIGGAYRFEDLTIASNLNNSSAYYRPEGAQFCDVDGDGDLDLFSNGVLHHNLTTMPGAPRFGKLQQFPKVPARIHDEGALFCDYDQDGDFDLIAVWIANPPGMRLFENRGDGSFFNTGLIPSPGAGLGLGLSVADYDNDGDLDINTRSFFRRNLMVETGQRGYAMATHTIPQVDINRATISWGDLDKDGDVDALIGNFGSTAKVYRNTLYDNTPANSKHHLRIRPVRDSRSVTRGLENEFGAIAEVHVAGDLARHRRFTTSASGYINQDEYTLNFALPKRIPATATRFDISVDFPSLPSQGYWRVDKRINPILGNLRLTDLKGAREVIVFRSGKVEIQGKIFPPNPNTSPSLTTTTDGLVLAQTTTFPTRPASEPNGTFVGMAFDTRSATRPVQVQELLIDGELAPSTTCGNLKYNIALWDVTNPAAPTLAHTRSLKSDIRNDRHFYRMNLALRPNRDYRLVANVRKSRMTQTSLPRTQGSIQVQGGLRFQSTAPCVGTDVANASLDTAGVYLAFRFADDAATDWLDVGHGLGGARIAPTLQATGRLAPNQGVTVTLDSRRPGTPGIMVMGSSPVLVPFLGGTLVPATDLLVAGIVTDGSGRWQVNTTWAPGVPKHLSLYFQAWLADGSGPQGAVASNGLIGITR